MPIPPSTNAPVPLNYYQRITPTQLPQWNRALAKVAAGSGNARILGLGDSITAGFGAVSAGSSAGARPYSWTHQLVTLLNSYGYNAQDDNFIGTNNTTGVISLYDSRFSGGTGWTSTTNSAFGGSFLNSNATTNKLSFTPTNAFDTIEICVGTNTSGTGNFTVNVDGGATLAIISCTATPNIVRTNISCTLGYHTINITPSSTSNIYISSIICYNSTISQIIVMNAGAIGLTSAYPTAYTTYGMPYWLAAQAYTPDITVLGLLANDEINSVATTTTTSNLVADIAAIKLYNTDCYLWTNPQPQTSYITTATYLTYRTAMYAAALNAGCTVFDCGGQFGLWSYANSNGYMSDQYHFNSTGYLQLAKYHFQYLMAL